MDVLEPLPSCFNQKEVSNFRSLNRSSSSKLPPSPMTQRKRKQDTEDGRPEKKQKSTSKSKCLELLELAPLQTDPVTSFFNSRTINIGQSFSFTLDKPGMHQKFTGNLLSFIPNHGLIYQNLQSTQLEKVPASDFRYVKDIAQNLGLVPNDSGSDTDSDLQFSADPLTLEYMSAGKAPGRGPGSRMKNAERTRRLRHKLGRVPQTNFRAQPGLQSGTIQSGMISLKDTTQKAIPQKSRSGRARRKKNPVRKWTMNYITFRHTRPDFEATHHRTPNRGRTSGHAASSPNAIICMLKADIQFNKQKGGLFYFMHTNYGNCLGDVAMFRNVQLGVMNIQQMAADKHYTCQILSVLCDFCYVSESGRHTVPRCSFVTAVRRFDRKDEGWLPVSLGKMKQGRDYVEPIEALQKRRVISPETARKYISESSGPIGIRFRRFQDREYVNKQMRKLQKKLFGPLQV